MPAATPTVTYADNEDGTVTATITGSTAGSTNKVLCSRWAASILAVAFTQFATRVGDGTVTFSVSEVGLHFALVRSEVAATDVALSAISSFRATDGLAAIHWQCCEAIRETIQALSLPDMEPENIVTMKLPWNGFEEVGPLGIIVSPIREELESEDNERDDMDYRVQVSFLEASDGNLTLGLRDGLNRRELVVRAFSEKTLPAVAESYLTLVAPGPIIVPDGVEAMYDVGGILLHCMCHVARRVA